MKIQTLMPFRPKEKMRGLGDVVHRIAKPIANVIGLKDCGGCEKRRQQLNEKFPMKNILVLIVMFVAITSRAQSYDFGYSTNLFYALSFYTNIYNGTNGSDTNCDTYNVWANKINHGFQLTAIWNAANSNAAASANSKIAMGVTTNIQVVDGTVIGGVFVVGKTNTLCFTNGLLMNVTSP